MTPPEELRERLLAGLEISVCYSSLKSCRENWPTDPASWCCGCQALAAAELLRAAAETLAAQAADVARLTAERDLSKRFDELRALRDGWDGYNAPALDKATISRAQAFLAAVSVVPCADGGVQLEWHLKPDIDLEVEFEPNGEVLIYSAETEIERKRAEAAEASLRAVQQDDPR